MVSLSQTTWRETESLLYLSVSGIRLRKRLTRTLKPYTINSWPNLQTKCRMYVHEATSLSLVSLFFDKKWWAENFDYLPPGFVGARTGLPLKVTGSQLGYAQKGSKIN